MFHIRTSQCWNLIIFIQLIGIIMIPHAGAVTVVTPLPNGSGFSAENDQLVVHIAAGGVTNYAKLPHTGLPDTRSAGVRLEQWVENMAYRLSERASGCAFFGRTFPLANWTISWHRGPADSAVFQQVAKFGPDLACTIIAEIYVADQPMTIQVAGHTVQLEPSQIKYSLDVDCPWQPLIAQSIGFPVTTTNITLVGRKSGPQLLVSAVTDSERLTDLINPLTDLKPSQGPDVPWIFYNEWLLKRCNLSTDTINSRPALQPIWPGFNYSDYTEISIHFGQQPLSYTTVNRFQAWTWSDNFNFTNVDVYLPPDSLLSMVAESLSDGLFRYQLPIDLQLHFVNQTSYDPTIGFLFGDFGSTVGAPDASSAPADAQAAAQASQTAIIAAVVVVAIVLVVVVALIILVFRNQRFRQLVLPYTQRVALNEQMNETTAKSATPTAREPANWLAGRLSVLKAQAAL